MKFTVTNNKKKKSTSSPGNWLCSKNRNLMVTICKKMWENLTHRKIFIFYIKDSPLWIRISLKKIHRSLTMKCKLIHAKKSLDTAFKYILNYILHTLKCFSKTRITSSRAFMQFKSATLTGAVHLFPWANFLKWETFE